MRDIAVIFDLDGTLLDTLEDLRDAVNHVLAERGYPARSLEEIRRFVGNGAKKLIDRALPETVGEAVQMETFQAFQTYYKANCQIKTKPYDGVPELLEQLKWEGYPLAVVSNKPDAAVKALCDQYFPGLYARGESAECPRKPAPDMVFRAAEALGVPLHQCIYVGDSEVDVQTARNAHMECISVLWGFRDEEDLRREGAHRFCNKTMELPGIVREMENMIYGK